MSESRRARGILSEIDGLLIHKDKANLIESRATNVIQGAINLISYIKENYDTETALELERRLINSIRGQDASKFSRAIRKLKDEN